MDDLKKKAGKQFNKCEVARLKGHGEANPEELEEYAMHPNSRRLIQLSWEKVKDILEIEKIMGEDVDTRKAILNIE